MTVDDLRPVDLFDDLTDEELAEWAKVAKPREAAPGDVIADQGSETSAVLLLEGTAEALLVAGDRTESAGRHYAPTWMGAISVLTDAPLGARVVAVTPCRLAIVQRDDFRRLAFAQPAILKRVMHVVGPVIARVTAIEQQRERLTALGTMAAGLAHELNNPAAAAQRAAAQLAEALDIVGSTMRRFVEAGLERSDAETLLALRQEAVDGAATRTKLDALDAADAEDELLDQLEALRVPEPWRLAEPLAGAGVTQDWLDRVASAAGPATDAALCWVSATLTAQGLASELQESTRRMSDLVGAVKTYAYMDRGDTVEVDLHEGLETTLAVLGHKLKHTQIEVVRDYDRDLGRLTVRGSELNQVWTNLLDNAIDALAGQGTITIRTAREGAAALVQIGDDGPGIPEDARDHIFDSFYTTKDVGKGTGLGWRPRGGSSSTATAGR